MKSTLLPKNKQNKTENKLDFFPQITIETVIFT